MTLLIRTKTITIAAAQTKTQKVERKKRGNEVLLHTRVDGLASVFGSSLPEA